MGAHKKRLFFCHYGSVFRKLNGKVLETMQERQETFPIVQEYCDKKEDVRKAKCVFQGFCALEFRVVNFKNGGKVEKVKLKNNCSGYIFLKIFVIVESHQSDQIHQSKSSRTYTQLKERCLPRKDHKKRNQQFYEIPS